MAKRKRKLNEIAGGSIVLELPELSSEKIAEQIKTLEEEQRKATIKDRVFKITIETSSVLEKTLIFHGSIDSAKVYLEKLFKKERYLGNLKKPVDFKIIDYNNQIVDWRILK